VWRELEAREGVEAELVHTGQHYDERMSESFLRELEVKAPDVMLGVGSGSHARQTADVLVRFEEYLLDRCPDLVVVVGDVNSTLAASLASVKLHVPVAHVEAGLRSGDRRMPEEINRLATDAIASLLFVTEQSGVDHLRAEGAAEHRVHLVGNTMIDTLLRYRERALSKALPDGLPGRFGLVTLHRPSNVDASETLAPIVTVLEELSGELPLWWPVHPRTEKNLRGFGLLDRLEQNPSIHLVPPAGYTEFLGLMARAALILTDSGGIQEEALVLKVPVVTLRENTERPSTVECGGNLLAGTDPARIRAAAREMLARSPDSFRTPPLWDGKSGARVADAILRYLGDGGGL
jgi:UDP-N-acetylglucosamine 2-epimerase (non-hydrolysing)